MSPSPQFMEGLWVRKSFSAAGHTLLVYDYLLTFREEVVYIWDAPWTVVKILFLLNWYGNLNGQTVIRLEEALLVHDSQKFCQGFAVFTTCFMYVSTESVHILVLVLVLVRAWAIWGTRKRVTIILTWSYVGYILMLLTSSVRSLNTKNSGSLACFASFLLLSIKMVAPLVQFMFLDVIQVCVTKMPSM
ncbi:hypothetical protein BDR03DRAFT_927672 [Suillus americanus]|nr:hypothetical protein BDR03DRAFT_927672 [Suillus americanus]